ncbi:amino acid--tRNA ligase-related protein, partial [Caldivirga sp.]|uniref:amino acid--tRNA ligase-related protein n=1 Tax=Caldivirga sp. TaxID=2080243 RepID=UPI003D1022E4
QETTPLCKPHRSKPGLIERFELYIAGMELANAYTELNDPQLQHRFFEEEAERFRGGDEEAHPYDYDFVLALSYGMPPTGGLGVGIDRLVMVLTGQYSIKEVIPFPMIKHS